MTQEQNTRLLEIVRRVVTSEVAHPLVREFYAEYLMGRDVPSIKPLLPLSDGGNLRGALSDGVLIKIAAGPRDAEFFLDELEYKVDRYIRMRSIALSNTNLNHEETNNDNAQS